MEIIEKGVAWLLAYMAAEPASLSNFSPSAQRIVLAETGWSQKENW
jgi:hypothetical protein